MDAIRIQARFIMPEPGAIIQGGQIVVRHGKIADLTTRAIDRADIDLGDCVLLPGLVNPHTHLEFSSLTSPFPASKDFPDWIKSVVEHRRELSSRLDIADLEATFRASIQAGLTESYRCGVAALCDIVTPPWSTADVSNQTGEEQPAVAVRCPNLPEIVVKNVSRQDLLEHLPNSAEQPRVLACLEHIGLDDQRVTDIRKWVRETEAIPKNNWPARLLALGVSPHAPYSTQWSFMKETIDRARVSGKLLAMHVAESLDERQWLDSGTGAFRDLFQRLGVMAFDSDRPKLLDVIEYLGQAKPALLIHGNYLYREEIAAIARVRESLSIVYCPRTHSHFRHGEYPLKRFVQAGLRVVLGTDSRASNPDLNLWQEARTAVSKHAEFSPRDAIRAITNEAAGALGLSQRFGSLTIGCEASLNVAPAPSSKVPDVDFCGWLLDAIEHPVPLADVLKP